MKLLLILTCALGAQDAPRVDVAENRGRAEIQVAGADVATYVPGDGKTTRPYFMHLKAPGGIQVTRNHPPQSGKDATDHDTMHPGMWLSFGALGGNDYWRNKSRVVHERFLEKPRSGKGEGGFRALHSYRGANDETIAEETLDWRLLVRPEGYLIVWTSEFAPKGKAIVFGDQEEMGLGVRLATPLTVTKGGSIVDAMGRKDEKGVWSKTATWCEYFGKIDGKRVGVVLMPDPHDFRPAWWHVRDYGLMVANPFGRNAFTKGEPSRVTVQPEERLRLRFGVLLYANAEGRSPAAQAYEAFLKLR